MTDNMLMGSILLGLSILTLSPAYAHNDEGTLKNKIQDSKKAVQYFEDEMNFKTNPHGVKDVVDGEVKNVTIIDVRAAKDFAEGHIPGAINIPFDKYNMFDGKETEFPGLRKDGFNYIYCYELLCNLAQKAAKKFASLGYPVKEIAGGFKSWKETYPQVISTEK